LLCRVMLTPALDGLELRVTVKNDSSQTLHNLTLLSDYRQTSHAGGLESQLRETWEQTGTFSSSRQTGEAGDGEQWNLNAPVALGDLAGGATFTLRGKLLLTTTAATPELS